MDRINSSVQRFKTTNYCAVNSCVTVLILCYLHRFNWKGRDAPTDLPLCVHWTDDIIQGRVDEEIIGGFGLQPLNTAYPITKGKRNRGPKYFIPAQLDEGFIKYEIKEGVLRNEEISAVSKDVSYSFCLCFYGVLFFFCCLWCSNEYTIIVQLV